jgi:hypothetical protein
MADVWKEGSVGYPAYIRSDNGPEFISNAVQKWLEKAGVETLSLFSHRRSPLGLRFEPSTSTQVTVLSPQGSFSIQLGKDSPRVSVHQIEFYGFCTHRNTSPSRKRPSEWRLRSNTVHYWQIRKVSDRFDS